jgi:hypothetical protein
MASELQGFVSCANMDTQSLATLLSQEFPDPSWAILSRVDWTEVRVLNPGAIKEIVNNWPQGRIFSQRAEVRWQLHGEDYNVIHFSEMNSALPGFSPLPGSPFNAVRTASKSDHGFLLWGTNPVEKTSIWQEARIPRPLNYPLKTKGVTPKISYLLYKQGHAVCWIRLSGFVEDKSDAKK